MPEFTPEFARSHSDLLIRSPWLAPASLTQTLRALVAINSVNPAFGGPAGGECSVAEWARQFLHGVGIEARLSEAMPGRPNLRARLEGEMAGPPILLETHMDTVSAERMSIDPFAGEVRDGRLWGRGATDAKAQATVMLHAMAAWAASGRRPPRAIELALVADEEFGFGGARSLLSEGIEAAGIVIGEPTDLRIITTHKGTIRLWIRVEGKAAHGARPHLGINAISMAAQIIREIEQEYAPELRTRRAALLDPPTINIGQIEGGLQANLVPPECRLHLDRRTIPGETAETVFKELEVLLERLRRRIPDFKASLEPPSMNAPPVLTDPDVPLVALAGRVAAAHGLPPEPMGVDYATDAAVLAATGLPIIIVGPGSIDQAHTGDEYVELDQLLAGARFFADLIGRVGPE